MHVPSTNYYIYKRNFDENRRIYFLIKGKKFIVNIWKFLGISSKTKLIVNLCIANNIYKLK